MKTEKEILKALEVLLREQEYINKHIDAGRCHWRINKAKQEALQWVLEQ